MSSPKEALSYYLDRTATRSEITDFLDWHKNHPGGDIAEYVEAIIALEGI